jgi:hypothetical protein
MKRYEFSAVVSDSVFGSARQVVAVEAASLNEALELARSMTGVVELGGLLVIIDLEPQVCLAF